jgi:hypothetical protein
MRQGLLAPGGRVDTSNVYSITAVLPRGFSPCVAGPDREASRAASELSHPVLHDKPGDPLELVLVAGHQPYTQADGVCGD